MMILSKPAHGFFHDALFKTLMMILVMLAISLYAPTLANAAGKRFDPEKDIVKNRAKLERVTQQSSPHTWAKANFRLGRALAYLGNKKNDVAMLDEAIASLNNTLTMWTQEKKGKKWADVQKALAFAYRAKSFLVEDDKEVLRKSIAHISNAYEMFVRLNNRSETQRTGEQFAEILSGAGIRDIRRDSDVAAGLELSKKALGGLEKEKNPVLWAKANLAHAEITRRQALVTSDKHLMRHAVESARTTIDVFQEYGLEFHRARAHYTMARALRALNWLDEDIQLAKRALFSYRQARDFFSARNDVERLAHIDGGEGVTLIFLAERYPEEYSAKTALEMITRAERVLRSLNLVRSANFYEEMIPVARRWVRYLGHW